MASLTPQSRRDEVTGQSLSEGFTAGAMVLAPACAALYFGLQNPTFRKLTNWQSRTAMVVMPALFAFGFASEDRLVHRMREVANETEHALQTAEWAERERQRRIGLEKESTTKLMLKDPILHDKVAEKDDELRKLYRQSILENGHVNVVESDSLRAHHQLANYVHDNPIKVLGGIGVPAVAMIFYGRSGKAHLNLQMKLLHTRVMGQFAVLCTLLSVMTIKEVMDRNGHFVTEADVDQKVQHMIDARHALLDRLESQAKQEQKKAYIAPHMEAKKLM